MRVSYVWHDHECYLVTLDGTLVGMLFKTFEGYWTFKPYEVDDDELQAFLEASFPSAYYEKLIIAKREINKKLRGWCG
jgi:ribosome-associated toxin RatA of RatAB toxin-antitoxin module